MTLSEIRQKIHEYYLESEKDGLETNKTRTKGEYPNAILLTEEQYKVLLREMFKLQEDVSDEVLNEVKIMSIEGLKVVFTEYIEEPKILRIEK